MQAQLAERDGPIKNLSSNKEALEMIIAEKGLGLKGNLLDLGIGTGETAAFFAEKGFRVYGVEKQASFVSHARMRAKIRRIKMEIIVGDYLVPSFPFIHFNDLESPRDIDIFYCLTEDEEHAKKVVRSLAYAKPGSWLIMTSTKRYEEKRCLGFKEKLRIYNIAKKEDDIEAICFLQKPLNTSD